MYHVRVHGDLLRENVRTAARHYEASYHEDRGGEWLRAEGDRHLVIQVEEEILLKDKYIWWTAPQDYGHHTGRPTELKRYIHRLEGRFHGTLHQLIVQEHNVIQLLDQASYQPSARVESHNHEKYFERDRDADHAVLQSVLHWHAEAARD